MTEINKNQTEIGKQMTKDNEFPEDQISEWQASFLNKLKTQHIPSGLGNEGEECTVAAANMAISGRLTDQAHPCMSPVIVRWIIRIQDALPDDMRNSDEWKSAAVGLIGTGREHEQERRQIIVDWLWEIVMPYFQPYADRIGMHVEWQELIEKRDYETAVKVRELALMKRKQFCVVDVDVAAAAVVDVDVAAAAVVDVDVAAAAVVDVVDVAAAAVVDVAAAVVDVVAAADVVDVAAAVAAAAVAAVAAAAVADAVVDVVVAAAVDVAAVVDVADARRKFFTSIDIYGVLRRLIEVNNPKDEQ